MSNQLIDYLLSCDFDQDAITEGSSSTESSDWLIDIITTHAPEAKKIMEIGLNLGHSSDKLLTNTDAHITSFDLLEFDYSEFVVDYFKKYYANRHDIISGDSTIVVPQYAKETNNKFDVIFIDGGHAYEIAKADLENCRILSNKNTIVILDDVVRNGYFDGNPVFAQHWNYGPTKVWDEMVAAGIIEEIEGSYRVFAGGRGLVAGRYIR